MHENQITARMLAAIGARFGLDTRAAKRLDHRGTTHIVFLLDDVVLRIPRDAAYAITGVEREATIVMAARAAGVSTPAVVATDVSCEIVPVAYSLYERVRGTTLDYIAHDAENIRDTWRQLGRDLARLHNGIDHSGPVAQLGADTADPDPRPWLTEIVAADALPLASAHYLAAWLDRLAPLALPQRSLVLCHGDVNRSNVMVDAQTGIYLALIDWAGAIWADKANDFACVSLDAVPYMLEGYRAMEAAPRDATLEARIVWQHLRLALFGMRRDAHQHTPALAVRAAALYQSIERFAATPCAQWLASLEPPSIGTSL